MTRAHRNRLDPIEEALESIEARLDTALTVAALARDVGFSPSHFQRVFHAVVGEPVGAYVRRRRLARAVPALLEGGDRIVDIALAVGFESHEAFGRAFKTQFEMTPAEFRQRGSRFHGLAGPRLARSRLLLREEYRFREPEIVEREAFTVVGYRAPFVSALVEGSEHRDVIPGLWRRYLAARDTISARSDPDDYGVCIASADQDFTSSSELDYLAGAVVSRVGEPPTGMSHVEIPQQTYARFRHPGSIDDIDQTLLFAFLDWLPDSGHDYRAGFEVEIHSGTDQRCIDYYLPIESQPRARA